MLKFRRLQGLMSSTKSLKASTINGNIIIIKPSPIPILELILILFLTPGLWNSFGLACDIHHTHTQPLHCETELEWKMLKMAQTLLKFKQEKRNLEGKVWFVSRCSDHQNEA